MCDRRRLILGHCRSSPRPLLRQGQPAPANVGRPAPQPSDLAKIPPVVLDRLHESPTRRHKRWGCRGRPQAIQAQFLLLVWPRIAINADITIFYLADARGFVGILIRHLSIVRDIPMAIPPPLVAGCVDPREVGDQRGRQPSFDTGECGKESRFFGRWPWLRVA